MNRTSYFRPGRARWPGCHKVTANGFSQKILNFLGSGSDSASDKFEVHRDGKSESATRLYFNPSYPGHDRPLREFKIFVLPHSRGLCAITSASSSDKKGYDVSGITHPAPPSNSDLNLF